MQLTTEGCNRAEHAAVHYAFRLAGMIASHTCDLGRVASVVQYVKYLVTREAPVRVGSYQHWMCVRKKKQATLESAKILIFDF